jgi:hydroxymethylpyrimidine pyrophosphatase-like HAD family hydrolase
MIVNRNENIVCFDVDETLVFHEPEGYPQLAKLDLNYYGHWKTFGIHEEHVKLLKAYKKRGFYVRVWSNNGFRWASHVVEQLGLADFVDIVETKPAKYVDDKVDAGQVIGQHVYVPVEKKW